VEFQEELTEPRRLDHAIGHGAVLGLNTGARDGMLTLAGPGDDAVTEKHGIPRGGATCVRTASPVSIHVDGQGARRRRAGDEEAKIDGATKVAQDALDGEEVRVLWIMHVEADLLHRVADVGASEGEVLESPTKLR
jgi:hypothetical protein